ncbi:hypothetical protein [Paenibacillus ottowii]|uniref:Uncharacterized protein n=1 Tax=Paenibacillus ottowii TaxID=2315729 RepID=A0ABY3B3N5_9BACL|nr:hypothetical protein [Paenibacillus ottowii]TQR97469.1 hypothetical protein FKV70_16695 [Paenibacillus ottowii]
MKKKHFIVPALALGLIGGAVAVPNTIFADSDAAVTDSATSTAATQDAGTTTTSDHVITPQSLGNSFNFTSGGSATSSGTFEVPKGFGYVKLRIRNYANAPVDFTVEHNDSGKAYVDGQTISKNTETIWRSSDAMRSGRYTIQFRGGSNKVNVEVWGVAGSLPSDAK